MRERAVSGGRVYSVVLAASCLRSEPAGEVDVLRGGW